MLDQVVRVFGSLNLSFGLCFVSGFARRCGGGRFDGSGLRIGLWRVSGRVESCERL